MALLKDEDRAHLIEHFKSLETLVKMVVFTQQMECQYCKETRMIAEEIADLSDKISLEIYDFEKDKEIVETYNIDKIPATVIMRGGDNPKDYGIRYFGIPSGYEFSSLIEDIIMISGGASGLSQSTKEFLSNLKEPVHLQVFVTPT